MFWLTNALLLVIAIELALIYSSMAILVENYQLPIEIEKGKCP
jgi:hypothetical protein